MGLQKGMTNNPAGRPAGTPNRTTTEIKQLLVEFLNTNIASLQNSFDLLEPKDKLQFIRDLAKICLPAPKQEIEQINKPFESRVDLLFPPIEEILSQDA